VLFSRNKHRGPPHYLETYTRFRLLEPGSFSQYCGGYALGNTHSAWLGPPEPRHTPMILNRGANCSGPRRSASRRELNLLALLRSRPRGLTSRAGPFRSQPSCLLGGGFSSAARDEGTPIPPGAMQRFPAKPHWLLGRGLGPPWSRQMSRVALGKHQTCALPRHCGLPCLLLPRFCAGKTESSRVASGRLPTSTE
jgi:hypothetical protein